ncbi:MAG: polysaccharide biosynthesis protein [Defluviitaleaceae bacterium]|nr:polysaccharide biosynthesis protein [Defluviitaleaceae bacterium]
MRIRAYVIKSFLVLLDCLFCWVSWMAAVFATTYLFTRDPLFYVHPTVELSLIDIVNVNAWVMALAVIIFYTLCGVYKTLWQHPGVGTMIRIVTAVFFVSLAFYFTIFIRYGVWPNPGLGVMAFYFLLTLSLVPRITPKVWEIIRMYLGRFAKLPPNLTEEPVQTLIIGAGETAANLLLNPSRQGSRPRRIIGVLDKDPRKHGYTLHGVPILGGDDKIPQLVKERDVSEIIVAVPSMANDDLRRIVRLTPIKRCKVRLLAGISDNQSASALRELNITDLLGRSEVLLNETPLNAWLADKTVMVTGGGGSIGSEICRQLLNLNVKKIVVFDISENNAHNLKEELKVLFGAMGRYRVAIRIGSVQDTQRLDAVFSEFRPAIVFHAAAYKHVPLMEECPRLALDNNILGTFRTAQAAIRHKVERFVMISTDKAVNPTNVMGASKRLAELITLGLNTAQVTEFVCVRFGNVLESNGSVIPIFRRQIEAGGPVTVMHPNIIRYFMTIPEAAKLVLEAGSMAKGGEIFILDMGEQIKIADLAENMIRMSGLTPGVDIQIEYTGLRPGEKLYEELLLSEEGLTATLNNRIHVAKPETMPQLNQLLQLLEAGLPDKGDAQGLLMQYVPEYKPMDEEDRENEAG